MSPTSRTFPPGFLFGVSLSAQQTEGGLTANNWARWEAQGRLMDGQRFGDAIGWWPKPERDMDLAAGLGLSALRFSVEWSRLEPRPGEWDEAAFAHYREILAGLRARGLTPVVCLHHFTNPLWFEDRGGFLAKDAGASFERFARACAERLGDLCDLWLTFNEPNVYALMGYQTGEFPPGRKGAVIAHARVIAQLARCHARAYRAIKAARPGAQVGWTQHFLVLDPARPTSRLDRWAARTQDALFNEAFVRVLSEGRGAAIFRPWAGDLSDVAGCFDFVGYNLYGRQLVRFDLRCAGELFGRRVTPPGAPTGDGVDEGSPYGEAYPDGLYRVGKRLARLGKPLYVLEHGVPDARDRLRPWVLVRGLARVHDLLREGVDVRGYFHWTLTDNVEWNWGYKLRFGLVELDPATQARRVRPSGEIYGAIARRRTIGGELVERYAPELLTAA